MDTFFGSSKGSGRVETYCVSAEELNLGLGFLERFGLEKSMFRVDLYKN